MSKESVLEPTPADRVHAVVRAGVSLLPWVGGPFLELFNEIFVPPLSARRDRWLEELAEKLKALEDKIPNFKVEALATNEQFLTAVTHATQVANRTHQAEKREALKAAVLNVAIGSAPDEDLQLIFLRLVDTFTPWHLRLLSLLADPKRNPAAVAKARGMMMGGFNHILEAVYPQLQGQDDFVRLLIQDLARAGLTGGDNVMAMVSQHGLLEKRTTPIGDQFLAFITAPVESN